MYFCIVFYLLYVKLEEQYGLARHAMSIYERATSASKAVPTEVFGGIGDEEEQVIGAKERLSRKRKK